MPLSSFKLLKKHSTCLADLSSGERVLTGDVMDVSQLTANSSDGIITSAIKKKKKFKLVVYFNCRSTKYSNEIPSKD